MAVAGLASIVAVVIVVVADIVVMLDCPPVKEFPSADDN